MIDGGVLKQKATRGGSYDFKEGDRNVLLQLGVMTDDLKIGESDLWRARGGKCSKQRKQQVQKPRSRTLPTASQNSKEANLAAAGN